jgi:hypothetical protein
MQLLTGTTVDLEVDGKDKPGLWRERGFFLNVIVFDWRGRPRRRRLGGSESNIERGVIGEKYLMEPIGIVLRYCQRKCLRGLVEHHLAPFGGRLQFCMGI